MAKPSGIIEVHCYHCGHPIEVSSRTLSTSCPNCNKTVRVEDIVIKGYTGVTSFETCGSLIVKRRGHAVAKNRVVAHAGIEVKGRLQCDHALTAGRVLISGKAIWRGDLYANSLVVELGAVIESGRFKVPLEPLEPEETEDESNRY